MSCTVSGPFGVRAWLVEWVDLALVERTSGRNRVRAQVEVNPEAGEPAVPRSKDDDVSRFGSPTSLPLVSR